jgi:hypothetical protein
MLSEAPQDWGAAVRFISGELGSHAADLLADLAGRARRTGERYIAKATDKINPRTGGRSQAVTPPPMTQVAIVDKAQAMHAAKRLRAAQSVDAGSVTVFSKSDGLRDARGRTIGSLDVTGGLRTALDAVADLVEAGDLVGAGERLDDGVMDAYGEGGGQGDLSQFLGIVDYEGGLSFT